MSSNICYTLTILLVTVCVSFFSSMVVVMVSATNPTSLLDNIIDFSPHTEKHPSHGTIMAVGGDVEALRQHIFALEEYTIATTKDTRVAALTKLAADHGEIRQRLQDLCAPVLSDHDDTSRRAYQEREQLKVSEALLRDPNQDAQYLDKIEEMLARSAEKLEKLENLWTRTATTVQACKALTTSIDGLGPRMSALRRGAKMDDISETSGSPPPLEEPKAFTTAPTAPTAASEDEDDTAGEF